MEVLQNDDELLLMELEREDGIYSFIFHELEATNKKLKADLPQNELDEKPIIVENCEDVKTMSGFQKWTPISETLTTSPLLSANTTYMTASNFSKSFSYSDALNRNGITDFVKFGKSTLDYKFKLLSVGSATYSSFQQLCPLRSFNVCRAKTPFSHIQVPLVRNRQHKLKETAEYKNFWCGINKVADLRQLFPLDRDVHAPFAGANEYETKKKTEQIVY